MAGSPANIFLGPSATLPVVNTGGAIYEEVQVAAGGQTVFNLATFNYTPNTRSIFVFRKSGTNGGEVLRRGVDYTETSASVVTLAAGATNGDTFTFIAYAINNLTSAYATNGLPPAGTAGQVLQKNSGTDYDVSWFSLSALPVLTDGPRTNIPSASSTDLTGAAASTRNILITGNTQIDGFLVSSGQVWFCKLQQALTISNNAAITCPNGRSIKGQAGDSFILRATSANTVELLNYCHADSPTVHNIHNARLSLQAGVPVPTADASSASFNITPYQGNKITLWNGVGWQVQEFSEVGYNAVGSTNGLPYDVFVYTTGPTSVGLTIQAWSNVTTRAVSLALQDGIYVLNGSPQYKYVGTFVFSGGGIADTRRQRLLWNYYNRVLRNLLRQETAASWVYNVAVVRQANANALNQVEIVTGFQEDSLELKLQANVASNTVGNQLLSMIGWDSTTGQHADSSFSSVNLNTANYVSMNAAHLNIQPAAGYHQATWLELSSAVGTNTFYGNTGGMSGLHGMWRC